MPGRDPTHPTGSNRRRDQLGVARNDPCRRQTPLARSRFEKQARDKAMQVYP